MKVIQYVDPTGQTMVARVPRQGTEAIKLGSQLVVEESQEAVFFRDGRALDTFGPGRHTLATQNLPFLTELLGVPFEGKSPFQAAVVFVSTKKFLDLKWGTKEPVVYRDSELAMVRLRAFGKFAVRITNSQVFVNEVVGTMGVYTTDGVESYFKDVIVARLTDVMGENLQSIFDLPKVYDELAMALKARVADDFSKYGIVLVGLYLGAITRPTEVQMLFVVRAGMGAVGDMNQYMRFKTARGIEAAANQEGGTAGGGMGLGMGAGFGMMMPGMIRDAMGGGGGAPAGAAHLGRATEPRPGSLARCPRVPQARHRQPGCVPAGAAGAVPLRRLRSAGDRGGARRRHGTGGPDEAVVGGGL